jgi:hypothetical protein
MTRVTMRSTLRTRARIARRSVDDARADSRGGRQHHSRASSIDHLGDSVASTRDDDVIHFHSFMHSRG